jgi:hypothetical protein
LVKDQVLIMAITSQINRTATEREDLKFSAAEDKFI